MSDDSQRGSGHTAIFAVLLLLPMIYALSIGPVIFAVEKLHARSSMQEPVMTFYAPIFWMHEHTTMKLPIEKYLDWWDDLAS